VFHDILGLYDKFTPKFIKKYANLAEDAQKALESYRDEVVNGKFPAEENTFHMKDYKSNTPVKRRIIKNTR